MDDAAKCYMLEIKVRPNSPGAFLNLGNIYFMESGKDPENLGKALSYYRQSLALDPGSVEAHFNLAYVFFVQKDLSDALSQVDEVLKLDPQNAKALALRRQILP
jgi:tetratricopeptide (TPR) repeat protein